MPDANFTSTESELSLQSPARALRTTAWERIRNGLRSGQQQMADWQGGALAVSAVPGAGKSTGMAAAAALAIARYQLHARRQILIVTFTRSAAANIKAKVRKYLREELSLPPTGFVVHTLHGLALNIATRHPELSGLQLENATLITPNQGHRLIRTCVEQWIANHPRRYSRLLEGLYFDGEETERLRRQSVLRTEVLPDLAAIAIHEAKSSGYQPQQLRELSTQTSDDYGILEIAAGLYEQYENLMRSRDLIDYDDMILAALRVLENPSACKFEQNQVFAVFEDEAQDSTPLQTKLLEILATDPNTPDSPHLIRVGDPNQAINSTFTPADPIYFRQFCEECETQNRLATMDQAGRSSQIIIEAANFALNWVNRAYQNKISERQSAALPFRLQQIRPVAASDPQPDANPAPIGRGLELYTPRDIHHTAELIGKRLVELFTENPNGSVAILVRENRQGRWLVQKLSPICREHKIPLYEVSESDRHSHVPAEILAILQFLDRPHSSEYLKAALEVLVQRQLIPTQDLNALASVPEQFLYPGPLDPSPSKAALQARNLCCSMLRARMELPYYQLIAFVASELKYDQAELATADKLAERIARQITGNSLSEAIFVLNEIVSSERFEPVETEEVEARYTRPGQVTIVTMHKAKGLDWDAVFIPFLHENLIPGNFWIPPQTKFLGDFTLAEVARAQIRAALHQEFPLPNVTKASEQAKQLKTAEEYRLLYVAMTRAKRLLWMSAALKAPFAWSKPENFETRPPCPVFPALQRQFPKSVVRSY
ncbi:ATP-dependent helicase [Chroococcidiopsis sp. TS-821]|uniref:ATP-dependent helicase n=1 Tax=Chroococcidiopsis sp. TS-821 TaxID=1378066 RepID=UPI000CEF4673|nr:ATP-dependent helicase [Chroococcidiopsis sp. TS-821]PPS40713.1 DNA helicase UvrD [Chroococcidiopsis sp. TS-821]